MENLNEYIKRIKILDETSISDVEFVKALQKQEWVIPAIMENSSDGAVKGIADKLISLLRAPDTSPEEIRRTARNLLQNSKKCKSKTGKEKRLEIFTLAWWSAVAGLSSTLVAIVIGNKGIIEIYRLLTQNREVNSPILDPITVVTPALDSQPIISPFETTIALVHVGLIILFIFLQFTYFGKPPADKMPKEDFAKKTFRQFSWGWFFIWVTWLLLYLWLSYCGGYSGWDKNWSSLVWSVADVLNILNSFAFFFCFLVFDTQSVSRGEQKDETKPFWRKVTLITTIGLVLATLSVLGRYHYFGLDDSGPFLSACYTGLAMAYFFGRLDSFILALPRYMLVPLYLYVIIQAKWVSFGGYEADSLEPAMFFGLALILKALLFILVAHWIHDGSISKYLDKAGKAIDKQNISYARTTVEA
ncbi:MAG TPA: hypothetical protein VF602_00550 [Pedobacter sp.]|jgi:hypothetical protein